MVKGYNLHDIIDDLEIIGSGVNKHHQSFAICRCTKCGREKNVVKSSLDNHKGTSHKSCGQGIKTKYPQFYQKWCGLKSRIHNENHSRYKLYGGRGLECDYDNFIDFYDDMFESYIEYRKTHSDAETTLDRIDNDKGYVKGNLRWADQKTQVNNSRIMRKVLATNIITHESVLVTNQSDFAKERGLSAKQIAGVLSGRYRTTKGWTFKYLDR